MLDIVQSWNLKCQQSDNLNIIFVLIMSINRGSLLVIKIPINLLIIIFFSPFLPAKNEGGGEGEGLPEYCEYIIIQFRTSCEIAA